MRDHATFDALVIGAGPAGAAAAYGLARAGCRVALVDRTPFPRDKTCGDGLIPDALGALTTMGLRGAIAREAIAAPALRVYAPNGTHVELKGEFLCLPRQRLDAMLVDSAVAAGAELLPPMTAVGSVEADGRVVGARFSTQVGEQVLRARVTLLATGANATVAQRFGLPLPLKPNAVAGRAYFDVPAEFAALHPHLAIVYERSLCPGYGWIFPGPGGRYNAGVGFFSNGGDEAPGLHALWRRFTTAFAPARHLMSVGRQVTAFRGAPLRTGLEGGLLGRPGLLVLGDAAATTYPSTGEGIGKAMQGGLLAATLAVDALAGRRRADTLHAEFGMAFRRAYEGRYRAYRTAQAWSSHPWLLNLLAARANSGTFVRTELEALIAERGDPSRLFGWRGLLRALWR